MQYFKAVFVGILLKNVEENTYFAVAGFVFILYLLNLIMKKLLFFVFALFASTVSAQHIDADGADDYRKRPIRRVFNEVDFIESLPERKSTCSENSYRVNVPKGDVKVYYADYAEYLRGLGFLGGRIHYSTNVVFAESDIVYIQNMFARSLLGETYLKGSLNEDETKITVDNNAYVGEYNGCKFFLRNIDPEKLTVIEEPIVFLYDKTSGKISSDYTLGLFVEGSSVSGIYTFGYSFSLFSENAFPASEKYSMQCIDGEGNDVAGEIEVIEDGYNSLIKGIDPAYPEAWGYGIVSDSFISVYNNIVYDDIFLTTLDSNGNLGGVNLFYDESSGSYMLPSSFSMVNLKSFENDSDEWWYVNSFRNIEVHKNTTGISEISDNYNGKEISRVDYYDLSGRKVTKPLNGLHIRVVRFSDGASISEKYLVGE